jgi:hypothetical protein
MPQLPLQIDVKDPKSAMAAVMQMTLKHGQKFGHQLILRLKQSFKS